MLAPGCEPSNCDGRNGKYSIRGLCAMICRLRYNICLQPCEAGRDSSKRKKCVMFSKLSTRTIDRWKLRTGLVRCIVCTHSCRVNYVCVLVSKFLKPLTPLQKTMSIPTRVSPCIIGLHVSDRSDSRAMGA